MTRWKQVIQKIAAEQAREQLIESILRREPLESQTEKNKQHYRAGLKKVLK